MQVNVHEAKSQLSRLLELVEQGETVVIARHGPIRRTSRLGVTPHLLHPSSGSNSGHLGTFESEFPSGDLGRTMTSRKRK
ncbi:MAG: type II toxin-antitoxin system Phd/YefM family antitoxin [Bryobacterales bacterium]|nr:type II toxin-antitoxin system Phd/YefM family antitoxin [Bryobacterales bacterium]